MRKLKFRAWDSERKTYDHEEILLAPNGDLLASRWQELCEPESEYIIEQCTGLKDRDGKEIYEGDILQYFGATLVAEYHDEAFWGVIYDTKEAWNIRKFIGVSGARVIGNIHENPELLGDTNATNKEAE